MPRCFKINSADNVATMLDDGTDGAQIAVLGASPGLSLTVRGTIKLGHKIALRDIAAGQSILKFGVSIGHASRDIASGDWVHLHNCTSLFDERSQTLDLHTGAATDTKYE